MMGRRCYVLLRCHYDVRIRRPRDALLRHLADVLSRRRWVLHLRRTWTSLGGTERRRCLVTEIAL